MLSRVESGAYSTVSEVVRTAIRLLQEREPPLVRIRPLTAVLLA
ncbi:MAG: ribbon-helix-helix domain-containing protein [Janthinobacterium lividum]